MAMGEQKASIPQRLNPPNFVGVWALSTPKTTLTQNKTDAQIAIVIDVSNRIQTEDVERTFNSTVLVMQYENDRWEGQNVDLFLS